MVWGTPIAIYLFFAGAGAGAFITAITSHLYGRRSFEPLLKAGIIVSGPLVAIGMPFLIMDLGIGRREPWRIINLYTNPGSVMTWGAWIITLFIPVALLLATFEIQWSWSHAPFSFFYRIWDRNRKRLVFRAIVAVLSLVKAIWEFLLRQRQTLLVIGTVLAFSTAIYTGLLLGVVNAVPIWNNSILPMLFFVSALSSGLAAAVVFAVIFPSEDRKLLEEHFFYLNQVHSVMIVVEMIFVFCWLFVAAHGSDAAGMSVSRLLGGDLAWLFWVGVIFFGIIDPLLIYVYEVVLHRPLMTYGMIISDSSVLLGGFVLRYLALAAAVPIILS
jgi:polysulfide reductase chain C